MKKEVIKIPANIKYLTEREKFIEEFGKPFELPNGILNKEIPGCGATTVALTDEHKTIICSPRNELLKNKHEQYPDTLLVIGGVDTKEIEAYLQTAELPKILVSYDSVYKLIGCIKYKSDWRVVVDEFQCLLADSSFKSEIELHFLDNSRSFPYVTFLSATPILDKYLEQIDHFKDMNYYQLDWEEKDIVRVYRERTKNPINAALEIVRYYQNGNYPSVYVNGERIYSKECVIFLNSVNNIVNIIKQTELNPEEVNIIVGNSDDNDRQIARIGEGFKRGRIPLKGETHKKFTFCTSTVYIGADFYSTNAYSYIFANPLVKSMTVDVSVDLQQIIGRQRLDTNPFRNTATLYFNTRKSKVTEEELENSIKEKKDKTKKQIDNFNAVPNKDEQLQMMENTIRQQGHKEHYCCIIKDADNNVRIVENEILEISERRAWEVTNRIYNNDFSMYRALRVGAVVTKSSGSDDPEVQRIFKEWNLDNQFPRKARLYCDLYDNFPELLEDCTFIEGKYKKYHDALGKEGFEALCWREDYIRQAIEPTPFDKLPKDQIAVKLIDALKTDKTYTKSEVKDLLQGIYKELNITGKPSASDISEYLTCEDRTVRMKGKLIATFKVTSHFRTKISLFNRITDINHPEEYEIDKVLDIIKTDSYYHVAGKVDAVRKAKTKEEKEKAKMKLPAVTWNGTFKTKNRNDLIHYSSFTALDFDHIQPEKMDEFGKWLQGFSCVYAYYITPSGKGYKAIILHDNYEPLYHYDLYNQLLKLFDCPEIDKSTTDLARGNFLSYDPNLWKNPDPEPFHFVPSTSEPIIPETVTETIIRDEAGNEMITEDDSYVAKFLNTLSRQVVSDDSIIRILGKIWTGKSIANGRNNTTMSYAGVLCKAGVEKDRAKSFIEELIPDYDITEIIEYAYSHNTFGCERRKYKSRKNNFY